MYIKIGRVIDNKKFGHFQEVSNFLNVTNSENKIISKI